MGRNLVSFVGKNGKDKVEIFRQASWIPHNYLGFGGVKYANRGTRSLSPQS